MRFLFKRGRGARRRVVHLCAFDAKTGEPTMQPLCGRDGGVVFDTTSNVPWAKPICKRCKEVAAL
jgi:hypothetical protein